MGDCTRVLICFYRVKLGSPGAIRATAGSRQGGFGAGVSATDDDHIELFREAHGGHSTAALAAARANRSVPLRCAGDPCRNQFHGKLERSPFRGCQRPDVDDVACQLLAPGICH